MAKKQAPQQVDSRKDLMMMVMWVILIFMLMLFFALPTVLLLFVGLLPTLAAFLIDRSKEKYSALCAAGMNVAGVTPYFLELWAGNNSVDGVIEILSIFSLMVMYGSAGLGTAMFVLIPPAVISFLEVMAQRRIAQLRNEQKALLEEWGEEVALSNEEMQVMSETAEEA